MPKIIEAEWDLFRREILRREGTGPAQLRDARHAYYRGAKAMLELLLKNLAPGGEATAGDLELFGALEEELRAELGKERI